MEKKSYKARYFDDYHIEEKIGQNGKKKQVYVYHGKYFSWQSQQGILLTESHKVIAIRYLFLAVIAVVAHLIGATTTSQVNSVTIPALAGAWSLIPLIIEVWGIIRFAVAGSRVKEIDVSGIYKSITIGALIHALLLAIAVLTGGYIWITGGLLTVDLIVLCGYGVGMVCSYVIAKSQKGMHYIELPQDETSDGQKTR